MHREHGGRADRECCGEQLLDQEVALEIRLISIAEDFYERIGLDFNLNIKTDRNTAKFEPMIKNYFEALDKIHGYKK